MQPGQFDPYHKWLGIPPHEQPPTHYRLLGLSPFESDPDVIDRAADARMVILRSVVAGPNVNQSQPLLSQVAAARHCLLNPEARQAYDATLRGTIPLPLAGVVTPKRTPKTRVGSNINQIFAFKVVAGGIVGLAIGYAIVVGVLGIDPFGSPTAVQAPARMPPTQAAPPRIRETPSRPRPVVAHQSKDRPTGSQPGLGFAQELPTTQAAPKSKAPESLPPTAAPQVPLTARDDPLPPPAPKTEAPRPDPQVEPKPDPPIIVLALDAQTTVTGRELGTAFKEISDDLAKVLKLETKAQQQAAHEEMIWDLNRKLARKKYQFHFPVKDVERTARSATAEVGTPYEAIVFVKPQFSSITQISLPRSWREDKVLAIKPGDTIRLSGTPAIYTGSSPDRNDIVAFTVAVPESDTSYRVHLRNYDIEHLKGKPLLK